MNSRNLSVFGNHRYRRSLVKFCLFISYLIVIAQISERIGILNTLDWENYFYLSILGPLIKSLLNKYEIEKIAWVYPLILEYTINLVCWPCIQIIENLGKLGHKKLFPNSQFFSLIIIKNKYLTKQTTTTETDVVPVLVTEGEALCGEGWEKLRIVIFADLKVHSFKIFIEKKSWFIFCLKICLLTLGSLDRVPNWFPPCGAYPLSSISRNRDGSVLLHLFFLVQLPYDHEHTFLRMLTWVKGTIYIHGIQCIKLTHTQTRSKVP